MRAGFADPAPDSAASSPTDPRFSHNMLTPPILDNKRASMPSVFVPTALLREARRQKGLDTVDVPPVCILDPDGDLVRQLRQIGTAKPFAGWPCYHTELNTFDLGGHHVGLSAELLARLSPSSWPKSFLPAAASYWLASRRPVRLPQPGRLPIL